MFKRVTALMLSLIIFSSVPVLALNYDIQGAYDECCTLYPVFVENILSEGATPEKIIVFMGDVRDCLLELPEELNEDNFDHYIYDAINEAFTYRRNITVRDALTAAYPDAAAKAADGIISEDFSPVYETIKRYILDIKNPVVTLSIKGGDVSVHHAEMPEGAAIFVGFYDEEDTLIKAFINPAEEMKVDASYAKAYAFDSSLSPLCDSYTINY